ADFGGALKRHFDAIRGKSIDFAVLERYGDIGVFEATFDCGDVGNWQSLARLRGTDTEGNTVVGKHLGIGTRGTIVRSDGGHLIVTVGLDDCIVVHTPDATLIARKDREEEVREVARRLKDLGW